MTYFVTITNIDVPYNRPSTVEVEAKTKAQAVSIARRMVRDTGHSKRDGRLTYQVRKDF